MTKTNQTTASQAKDPAKAVVYARKRIAQAKEQAQQARQELLSALQNGSNDPVACAVKWNSEGALLAESVAEWWREVELRVEQRMTDGQDEFGAMLEGLHKTILNAEAKLLRGGFRQSSTCPWSNAVEGTKQQAAVAFRETGRTIHAVLNGEAQ